MQLFISYARTDRPKVDPLSQRLRQAGNDVWLDVDLTGGQVWWDNILHQIRHSDAFIAVVSRSSLKSQACLLERQYATLLGKPVLPLTVEPLNAETLPTDLSRLEIIDYSRPDEATAFRLIGAIAKFPPPPALPVPLPRPPDAPASYWGNIGDQVNAPALDLDQQLAVIGRIEGALGPTADPAERPIALDLLGQMERRTDLYAAVDRRIALLKQSLGTHASAGAGAAWSAGPGPSAPPNPGPTAPPGPGPSAPPGPGRTTGSPAGMHTAGAHPSAASPAGAAPRPPGGQPIAARPATASPHWVLAILALVCFWPTGIPAVVYASRVKPALAANDWTVAQKSSSRVVMFFWISLAVLVLLFLIGVAGSSGSSSSGAAHFFGYVADVNG